MIWVDYLIIAVIAFSVLVGVVRGFVREALSLAGWIAAFWVALNFSVRGATLLEPYIKSADLRVGSAFVILLITVLIATALLNLLAGLFVQKTGLSGTDRMLGVVFGVVRGAVIVALLVVIAGFTGVPHSPWWRRSLLIPEFQKAAVQARGWLPVDLARRIRY